MSEGWESLYFRDVGLKHSVSINKILRLRLSKIINVKVREIMLWTVIVFIYIYTKLAVKANKCSLICTFLKLEPFKLTNIFDNWPFLQKALKTSMHAKRPFLSYVRPLSSYREKPFTWKWTCGERNFHMDSFALRLMMTRIVEEEGLVVLLLKCFF